MPRDAVEILRKRREGDEAFEQQVALEKLCAEISQELYRARTNAGFTQTQLAKKIGTSQSAIARVEDADYDGHSLRTISKIANALGLRVAIRFEDTEARPISFAVSAAGAANQGIPARTGQTPWEAGVYVEKEKIHQEIDQETGHWKEAGKTETATGIATKAAAGT